MKAIDFVVRADAGGLQRGTMPGDAQNQTIVAGAGQEISINARQTDFKSQVREGDQLVITLSDGRTITIDNFFNETGEPNRLFISSEGYLNEVSFVDNGQGNLYAQYGPTSEWGKWSPSDDLIFLGDPQVAGVPLNSDGEEVSMLGAALLGGTGLLSSGAAVAAGVGGAAVIAGAAGGGGGGGSDGPAEPFVNDADGSSLIGGDDAEEQLTVSGGGEPGDEVVVTVGDKQIETIVDDEGEFEVVFEGDTFPEDGEYEAVVVFTDPDGGQTTLDGPDFVIDTTAPEIVVTSGVESTGDFFNSVTYVDGITLTGTGEAGARVDVTLGEVTQTTTVTETGTWTVSWEPGTFESGEFTLSAVIVTTDSFNNSRSYTETVVVDTVTTVTVDTATVGGDGVINGAEHGAGVTFTGTAQAGSSVEVTVGSVTHTVTATTEGTWTATFTSTEITTGEYQGLVSVLATDVHQNTATASGSFDVDTFVRDFAITSATGGDDGVINAEEAGQPLVVTGTTEPGSTVVVQLGETSVNATVSATGSWTATFATGSITSGTYTTTMTATATDAAGNVDTASTSVTVDTEAGVLTIDADPVETDDIVNEVEASDGVVLTGTADAGASVVVNMNGVSTTVTATNAGTWEAFFAAGDVAPGVYTADITATTTDAFGNSRSATDSVEVDTRVDNLALDTDNAGDDIVSGAEQAAGFAVTGTTEVGTTALEVTVGNQTVNASVDAQGNWTANFGAGAVDAGTYNTGITVTATDRAGNVKTVTGSIDVDTEVVPFALTSNSAGADQVVNAAEAGAGIDLGGVVEAGSSVRVTFDGTAYDASVDAAGNWSLTVPAADVRSGSYAANITVEATDHVGNTAVIEDTLSIDTEAPDGPVIASFTRAGDGIRGISIETEMVNGAPTEDVQSVVQVNTDGTITDVAGQQGFNSFRGETEFAFNDNVPNGAQLIVNATDAAGNTSGTYLVLDDESATNAVDLSNLALGEYQIENLDLDFAEAASVVIDEASLLALSTESNTLTIHGSAEDQVQIVGGALTGTQDVDGQSYNVYSVGSEGTLLIDPEIPVTI
ncbi:BapA prefix-like domain-containing protein [Sulfitobacter albidus]|uniref:BapA prefix-like domain-containing protein n=1 Tax=Sulfitobacter albidus TaxID=2829501 RepID=A0A975JFF3_9RHOB|nr:Ig-like domain-containing protein [Sulfitobacter albidus]QUJ77010.1 BapA prefix-like domain-containing protein [Sulfitobacter albidus]